MGFLELRLQCGVSHKERREAQGDFVWRQGSQVSMCVARGSASWLSHLLETGMLESGREDPSTGKSNPCLAGQWGSVGAFPHQPCPFCTVSWSRL